MNKKTALINDLLTHSVSSSSEALSLMLKTEVNLEASKSFFVPLWEIPDHFEPYEDVYTAIAMKIKGNLRGATLMALKENSALELAQVLAGILDTSNSNNLNELKSSALKETANIIFGALLTKISQVSSIELVSSIPALTTDMIKASLDELCGEIALESSHAFAFSTSFKIKPLNIEGILIFIIDEKAMDKIISKVT